MNSPLRLSSLFLATCLLCSAASESFRQTLPLTSDGKVSLDNINGSIEIIAWDKPEVCIEAEKKARSEEDLKRLQIKVQASADSVSISTDYQKSSFSFFSKSGSVDYKLYVPAQANLERIHSVNSSIKVTGVSGPQQLKTVNGSIRVQGIQSDCRMELVNGSIQASADKIPSKARLSLRTVNGSCELLIPTETGASVTAETINGHVTCDLPLAKSQIHRKRVEGHLGEGDATLTLNSVNGSLTIKKL